MIYKANGLGSGPRKVADHAALKGRPNWPVVKFPAFCFGEALESNET